MNYLKLLPLAVLLSFIGCIHQESHKDTVNKSITTYDNYNSGYLYNSIRCKDDSTINYSVYLPTSYKITVSSPILFFFDSHGSGMLPLKKYKALAEKYGYILVGSNNSKNGNGTDLNMRFATFTIQDALKRFNVNRSRIYTAGFSGGARVASAVAIFNGGINTTICIGAGFPTLEKPIEHEFNFIGIAGNEDFNFDELAALDLTLNSTQMHHVFYSFKGKHEWCKPDVLEKAFIWIELNEMKNGVIRRNDTLINRYVYEMNKQIKHCNEVNNLGETYLLSNEMLKTIKGLIQTDSLEGSIYHLEKDATVIKTFKRKSELAALEKSLKESYLNALALKDGNWWKQETIHLQNATKFQEDQLVINKRLLSYLSLACYMNINQLLKGNQLAEALHYIEIYKIIDPANAEGYYLDATILLQQGNKTAAIRQLKEAIQTGFHEIERFDKDFHSLESLPEFKSFRSSIIKNNDSL